MSLADEETELEASKMTSAVRTVIHRLLTLAEEGGYSERKDFLATEGLQFDPVCKVVSLSLHTTLFAVLLGR